MKKFSKRSVLVSTSLAFLGFTLIGITTTSTIIGIILFIPMTIVRTHNIKVENNLKYLNYKDEIKLIKFVWED